MSDEPIREGDNAYVAYKTTCCGSNIRLGYFLQVKSIKRYRDGRCSECGYIEDCLVAFGFGHATPFDLRRLRRIPPLSELETTNTDSEVTA